MTRISFLFGASNRHIAAADWLARNTGRLAPILVLLPDADALHSFDRLLWTRSALGFTPHCHIDSPLAAETPVVLATAGAVSGEGFSCLLNLGHSVPDAFARFTEMIEMISTDEAERAAGRDRFRFYRDSGYPLESIDISNGLPQ